MTDTWEQSLTALAIQHPGTRLTLIAVPAGWVAELKVPGVGKYVTTAHAGAVSAMERAVEMWKEVAGGTTE